MKPLKLVIQGIRSFSEKVEVDFESVSKNGLFGIFGTTGSGKSTILDSLIIALYGDINGQKMSELISARCKSAYVSLNFELSHKNDRHSYFVERTFKLKKDGSYGGAVASLYETTSGLNVVLASQTNEVNRIIEEVLGLGQNEFTKCIILPQGEFSQFVKAPKGERVKIIEKLFSLERFGESFNYKLKNKINALDVQLQIKEETVKQYQEGTKEALEEAQSVEIKTRESLNEINEKLCKIKDYIKENEFYYNLNIQYENDRIALSKLTSKKDEIEGKKIRANLFETAKNIVDANNVLEQKKNEYNLLNSQCDEIDRNFEIAQNNFKIAQEQYLKLNEIIEERQLLSNKKEQLLSCSGDFKRYGELNQIIKSNKASIDSCNKQIDELTKKLLDYSTIEVKTNRDLKEIEEKTKVTEVFSFISSATLSEEYKGQIEYYNRQLQKIEEYKGEGALFDYVSSEYNERLKFYLTKFSEVNISNCESCESAIETYKKSMQVKRQIEDCLKELSVEKTRIEESLKTLNSNLEKCVLDDEKYTEEYNVLNVKLLKIFGNIDSFENNLLFVSDQLKDITEREENVKNNYFNSKDNISKMQLEIQSKQSELKVVSSVVNEQQKVVESLLLGQVSSVEMAIDICSEDLDVDKLKEEIDSFEKDYDFYTKSVSRLKKEIENSKFSVEEYSQKTQESKEISSICENLKEKLINCQNITEKLSQYFDKRCIIEKDISSLRARVGVLKRLEHAVSRKAFSEFISAEFLSDVARSARITLLELTGGKYDVVYKDSLDGAKDGFYVLDNLNGGAERSVSSLSGGETFLVSLSLALALSAGIYAGSDRPMEFFFLDEGFGTLDENLVDTVLDSLEKLRNKKFSIGLISHLAEMKSRIDSKITVLPADETRGSRIVYQGAI